MTKNSKPRYPHKQLVTADLDARGRYVVGKDRRRGWLVVGCFGALAAGSYLVATVRFAARPSAFGTKGGRGTRLTIERHYRTTCLDLFLGQRASPTELYRFNEGGADFSYLEHNSDA